MSEQQLAVAHARQAWVQAFVEDPSIRRGYQANIAMLIAATQRGDGTRLDLTDAGACNVLADQILTLILGGPSTGGKV